MKNARSYLMMTGSMLIFGTIGIFRRYIPVPSGVLAFVRGLLGAVTLLLFALFRGKRIRFAADSKTRALMMLSGGTMGFNWILLFEAYNYTSVAVATLCYYMQPTMVILLSPLLFHERLTGKKLLCAAFSLLGMVLVSGLLEQDGSVGDIRGILFGLGAAALYAMVVILNKFLPPVDAGEKTVTQLSSAAVVMVPYLLLTGQFTGLAITPAVGALILVVGVVHTGIAYALYFGGMGGIRAQSIAVLSYIDPVSALLLSALILGERLTALGIVGAVLIIASALVSELVSAREA